jgi:DNA-directed RNA polymerase specialized sigma24 family protein
MTVTPAEFMAASPKSLNGSSPWAQRYAADVLADYLHLREDGHSLRQIAERMGMQYGSLCRALQRARRAGAL